MYLTKARVHEQLSYDTNRNIKTLKRYGQTEQATPRFSTASIYIISYIE